MVMVAAALSLGAGTAGAVKDTRTVKGHAQVQDWLTVGGYESLHVRGMPKRLPFQVVVGPSFDSPKCQGDFVCEPEISKRAPDTPLFRTSKRGRAKVFFRVPSGYTRHQLGGGPDEFVRYEVGDEIRVQANGFIFEKKIQTVGIAVDSGRAYFFPVKPPSQPQ
jgi:hypothetical protein